MRTAIALTRAAWLSAASYRFSMVVSLLGLAGTAVPLFFIAKALQPMMAASIASQGDQYFAFLVMGMVALTVVASAVNTLPAAIGSGIANGTLEAQLATPAGLPALLAGLGGYSMSWTALRGAVLVLTAALLGASFEWSRLPIGLAVLALIVLAHLPIGLAAAAGVMAFRSAGALPQGALVASTFLGGVYYPTSVIPSWLRAAADFVPLSYGLRALRRTMLEEQAGAAVMPDVLMLAAFALVGGGIAVLLFQLALRHAQRTGGTGQY